ncbi:LOW QUALITY PROTEIN: hypothetical protein Cgig2_021253 [Carnegiea gigantea]|uniref:Uncharacterized protein n=1 Tax=Carnegiea gigantea TaxID=171969 RepID=A0A9Q1JZT0_9CARY|nr:LOW QUALITY PROTEIN: hypothetical protein Cgig2_021253 [Carnegiea gigantea]
MAFPRSLSTKEMAEYVVRHFTWDWRGATFPLSPLPKDFQASCLSYELVVVEDYELPELPQMIFYVMLLNEAERLGVMYGRALRTSPVPDEGGTKGKFRGRPIGRGLEDGHVAEMSWPLGSWEYLPISQLSLCPLYKYNLIPLYMMLRYPSFRRKRYNGRGGKTKNDWYAHFPFHYGVSSTLQHQGYGRLWNPSSGTKGGLHVRLAPFPKITTSYAHTFHCPRPREQRPPLSSLKSSAFYAMLLNDTIELGVVHDFMAEGLRSALVDMRWSSFEAWMSRVDHKLREAQLR